MKKTFTITFVCLVAACFFGAGNKLLAQCASGSAAAAGAADIRVTSSSTASCQAGNTYYLWNVCAGDTYRWSTCASGSDTQITVRNSTGATQLAYNDDNGPACAGASASLNWTSTVDGQVRVYVHQYNCQANSPNLFCSPLTGSRVGNAPLTITCPNNISVNTTPDVCGATVSYTTPQSSGACESVARTVGLASGSVFSVGTHTVTYRATDIRSATQDCSFTVTVTDNQLPAVTCKAATVNLNTSGNANLTTALVKNSSGDNCNIATETVAPSTVNCSNVGTVSATLTVTDEHGNSSSCSSSVTVVDNLKPLAVCKDATVSLNASGLAVVDAATQIDNGSSDACGISSYTLDIGTFTCSDLGANTVAFRAIDSNGNTSDPCSATVTVQDNLAPNALCKNATVALDASGNAGLVADDIDDGTTDNCNLAFRLVNPTAFVCGDVGTNSVTLQVEDDYGNSSSCSSTVTIVDNTPPAVTCKNATVQLNSTGDGAILATSVQDSATDACGIDVDSRSVSPNVFNCDDVGTVAVTLSLADQNGNTGTCSATVTVQDNLAPSASCNSPVFVTLDASGNASLDAANVDGGSTDNCPNLSLNLSKTSYTCSDVGFSNNTLTVTDAGGNTSTCNAAVITQDVDPPTAVCQDATVVLDASGAGSITGDDLDGGSTDNCGITSKTPSVTDVDCSDIGVVAVTLTVSDLMGNTDACSANVTVQDNDPPSVTCSPTTIYLDGTGNASVALADIDPSASDNCAITSSSVTPNAFTCADIGSVSVSVSASDQSGNSTSCSANVTVAETTPPDALCADYTVNLSGGGGITGNDIDGGSTDNCGIDTRTASPNSFGCAELGVNSVTLTVTDNSGNSASCAASVTVVDDIAPTAVCADFTVTLDGSGNGSMVADDIDGGSTDNCTGFSTAASQTSFGCSDIGTAGVTLTVTDASGNTASCAANVTVAENTPPTAVCMSATVSLDASGSGTISGNDVDGGSTDNCGIASVSVAPDTFGCTDIGTQSATLTVSDGSGNTASCSASITVADEVAPSATCADITVDASGGSATVADADFDGGSTDNCGVDSFSASQTVFDCTDDGTSVTLTVSDASGNTGSCTATVSVLDSAPTAVCQNATVQLDASGNAAITASQVDGGSSDDCGSPSLSVAPSSFGCAGIGSNSVTLTVTDVNSNTSSCSASVTVEDALPPSPTCNDFTVVLVGSNGIITASNVSTATDNCGVASSSVDPFRFKCADVGTPTLVTVTVTDDNGNSATCSATVTTADNEVPLAICQDITVNVSGSPVTILGTDVDDNSDDNCTIVSYSVSPDTFDASDAGPNNVVLTVTDQSGNSSSCSSVVTVNVTTQPRLKAKVLLEGPYISGGLMETDLRDALLVPAANPFGVAPWFNAGGESVATKSDVPPAAVDWVWVELLSTSYTPVASRACFLLADGSIAELDGTEGAEFAGVPTGVDYYVIIRTRNHVDVISSGTVQLSNVSPYDFSSGQAQVMGSDQLIEVESGIFALTAGDIDGNGVINVHDYNIFKTEMSLMNGYYDSDLGMDDNVTVNDFNLYHRNASKIGAPLIRY